MCGAYPIVGYYVLWFKYGVLPTLHELREEAMATLPPGYDGDFTGERAVWEGKFCTY